MFMLLLAAADALTVREAYRDAGANAVSGTRAVLEALTQ